MEIVSLDATNQEEVRTKAITVLQAGGLIIFPTETAYGAGVDATNQEAVNKLLAYKNRREGQPMSIAVTDLAMASQFVEVNEQAASLYSQFLPGPVTVVSKSKHTVATGIESEFGTLGIRIPDYSWLLTLIENYGKPITATSANKTGQKTPYSIQDIFDNISDKQKGMIDLVIDAGQLPPNPPSTVIDTTLATPLTIRVGEIKITDTNDQFISTSEEDTQAFAQRFLLQHLKQIEQTGLIIALEGPLGAGKTVFTKGLAKALDITETITSPTYSYVEEYTFNKYSIDGTLYHADLWKLESSEQAAAIGMEDWCTTKHIIVIEWFSVVAEYSKKIAKKYSLPIIQITIEPHSATERALIVNELT